MKLSYIIFLSFVVSSFVVFPFLFLPFLCVSSPVHVLAHFLHGGTNNHVRLVQRPAGLGRLGHLGEAPLANRDAIRGGYGAIWDHRLGQSFGIVWGFHVVCLGLGTGTGMQRNHWDPFFAHHSPPDKYLTLASFSCGGQQCLK